MAVSETMIRVDELAQKLFDVVTQFCLTIPRHRRRSGDLKEVEFLTLSILCHHDMLIVGEIQRMLGVLPAQMSRIIRSLETREQPLIACRINPQDKRKIDVALTEPGRQACQEYQTSRIASITQFLSKMSEDDLENLNILLGKMHEQLETSAS
jgi:DNA-binding MarR family transcriptional regulator